VPSAYPKLACSVDTDGDGITNDKDLDSDGDGCSDAYESGTVTSNIETVAGPYSGNGFADALQAVSDTNIYKGIYTYQYATSSFINLCADTDGDGIPDLVDIDDDNDGILDAVEAPDCYYTGAEWLSGSRTDIKVSTSLTMNTTYNAPNELVDGDRGTALANAAVNFTATTTAAPTTVYNFEMPMPVQLDTLFLGYINTSSHFNASTVLKLQGSNDNSTWTDLNSGLTYSTTTATNGTTSVSGVTGTVNANVFPVTQNAGAYKYYRIYWVSGGGINATGYSNEAYFSTNTAYIPSANPKLTCTSDIDGDGITNDKDLDTDGDGCPDAIEGGAPFGGANLVESNIPGGNSGTTYNGTSTDSITVNLGNTVGTTPTTMGVPTIAGTGQSVGTSQNVLAQDSACCDAGYVAPLVVFDDTTIYCLNTFNLFSLGPIVANSENYTLVWSLQNPPLNSVDTLTFTQASTIDSAGMYYVYFRSKTTACFSPCDSFYVNIVCIDPDYESGTVTSATGGTAISNVAVNDTVNGIQATLGAGGNATISAVSFPSGISLNTTTGAITVTPGTIPGAYPVTYELCDKLTPTTCATQVDTVFVTPSIDSDGDGVLDEIDLDDDNDGILDTVEGDIDTDGDGIVNRLDLDSDGDDCADAVEAGVTSLNNVAAGDYYVINEVPNVSKLLPDALIFGIYDKNGFANSLQSTSDSNEYRGSYTYSQAIDGIQSAECLAAVLPIELVSFEATKNNDMTVTLTWITASELNNDKFIVERSIDAINWIDICEIKGKGFSNELETYYCVDNTPQIPNNYYRLKQIDFDGTYTYSNIEYINFDENLKAYNIYPNPFINELIIKSINLKTNQENSIKIYSLIGETLYTKISNQNSEKLDLSFLKPGSYILDINHNKFKIIKQ
jgi:hypothetical protein